jgi:hypothetical protein
MQYLELSGDEAKAVQAALFMLWGSTPNDAEASACEALRDRLLAASGRRRTKRDTSRKGSSHRRLC